MSVSPVSTTKLTAAGNIKASAGELIWLNVANPTAGGLTALFHDATSGTSSEVFQVSVGATSTVFLPFPAGFCFSNGIRCGTLGAGLIVTGGYR